MPLAVGTKAPDFTLKSKDANGLKDVTLSANFGKKNTVVLFFPLAFTSTCTAELCDMRDDYDQFTQYNVAILPTSACTEELLALGAGQGQVAVWRIPAPKDGDTISGNVPSTAATQASTSNASTRAGRRPTA